MPFAGRESELATLDCAAEAAGRGEPRTVIVEGHASERWADGLRARGHTVHEVGAHDSAFGHAHAIVRDNDDLLTGAADQRTRVGSAAGR